MKCMKEIPSPLSAALLVAIFPPFSSKVVYVFHEAKNYYQEYGSNIVKRGYLHFSDIFYASSLLNNYVIKSDCCWAI